MGDLVAISRGQLLERLAQIDAYLDILSEYDETELIIERDQIVWMLSD